MPKIGTLNEKPLHASLKTWYAKPNAQFEIKVDSFVIDIVQGNLLVEIQTGNFSSIKTKLKKLTKSHQVRLVYPIAQEKWLIKLPKDGGDKSIRRKSPKRGRVEDLFWEMVRIPELLGNKNFSLEILMTQEEEIRRYDKNKNWRRKGWGIVEHRLLAVVDRFPFENPTDWLALLPKEMDEFTTKDLSEALGISRKLSQKMAYTLRKANLIELAGKKGRANFYKVRNCNTFAKKS